MTRIFCNLFLIALVATISVNDAANASEHQHKQHSNKAKAQSTSLCADGDIRCAATVTTALSPNGDLWRVWVNNQQLYVQVSNDLGQTFSAPKPIAIARENIASRNENRPKIAFDQKGGVYLSWALSGKQRFTGDVRFSYSLDGGKSFSTPKTINNDGFITGHSFNEMTVSADGDVSIVWLDGRHRYLEQQAGRDFNGSELYLAQGNPSKGIAFDNQALARGTCVCCRIAMDTDSSGSLAIFWRHIFGDNIREFALITLDDKRPELAITQQISRDHWYIEGCPHQGGGISITDNNRYHLIWYNQGDHGKGIFYAFSNDAGKTMSIPLSVGDVNRQASHPHISHRDNIVDIVWLEFDGKEHQLWHQQSTDNGSSFKKATLLATSTTGADRPFLHAAKNQTMVSWQRPQTGHWLAAL